MKKGIVALLVAAIAFGAGAWLGRASRPENVASAVVFVAKAQAITSTTLLVDGGQHLVASPRDMMFLTEPAPADTSAS